jgi:glucose-1-phosphate cytidylyltransferase
MKVIILCGGLGTRLSEETDEKPKPMVAIDGQPILWHIMENFARQGFNEFILALGYKSEVIKRWLLDLNELSGSITVDTLNKSVKHVSEHTEISWKVTALETGLHTQTADRIAQCMRMFPDETFLATYGDGLANVSIRELIKFHENHKKLATVTAVRPPARFGHMEIRDNVVEKFGEKNQSDEGWINGGFFVLDREILKYHTKPTEPFETSVLAELVKNNELMAFQHEGFWQPMDTLREKRILMNYLAQGEKPWLVG